jgi:hypothetical protein
VKALTPALKELKDSEKDMRKQQFAMDTALQQFKQAQLSGDEARSEKARNRYETAVTNLDNAKNRNKDLGITVGLERAKQEFGYESGMAKQALEGAQALERTKIMASGQNKYYDALSKNLAFSNKVEKDRYDYVDSKLTTGDKMYLAMDSSTLKGKKLDAYNAALGRKKALEREAESMFRNLPSMEDNLVNPVAPKMPGSSTGKVKFLGFENIDTPKGR